MSKTVHIGFPPPLLGFCSVRLPLIYDDGESLALFKPAGILVEMDPWYPRIPVLVEAIRYQAGQGKPEFNRLGIPESGLWPVYSLDPECAGPIYFTRRKELAEEWKNRMGSGALSFRFELLCSGTPPSNVVSCDLPLARHRTNARMVVSHTSGKKSHTGFSRADPVGKYHLWEASTHFPRRHQILIHATESGLPVVGDTLYARQQKVFLSRLKHDYRPRKDSEENPLYAAPAYYLKEVQVEGKPFLTGPRPPKWDALLNQLRRHTSGH